jgi:rSAM/selenodomain-associated transferase 2
MPPLVSVIIPVLADEARAERLIAQITPDSRAEVIVSAAGAADLDSLTAGRRDVRTLRSEPGRGRQMNEGARLAHGDWLLFLHADSRLPREWLDAFEAAVSPRVMGGWFRFALDHDGWQARLVEHGVALRVSLFRLPYGDQGLFVRRPLFTSMGGFRDIPLMEDVDFVRRLGTRGPLVEVPCTITTSARRWTRDGWFRRSARNLTLLGLYFCGISPEHLARWYE